MRAHLKRCRFFSLASITFLLSCTTAFADVVIHGKRNINGSTAYHNVTLDLTNGRFSVNAGGVLEIDNCVIKSNISSTNPYMAEVNKGNLILKKSTVTAKVNGITPTPDAKATRSLLSVKEGLLTLTDNSFSVDKAFSISFLQTDDNVTNGFSIKGNSIKNFHGGIYLINSHHATVNNNTFYNVSYSNIYNQGNLNQFHENIFTFPGNLHSGNAFDIINSNSLVIENNIVSSAVNHGIFIMGGENLFIQYNKFTDGLSHAIYIATPSAAHAAFKELTSLSSKRKLFLLSNDNIVIDGNYFSQNRYGLAGGEVDTLIVTNNTFIQKFNDASVRQFWTNNDNLLPFAINLTWLNNTYKEAFTQDNEGDNSLALKFVPFPAHGGVLLS